MSIRSNILHNDIPIIRYFLVNFRSQLLFDRNLFLMDGPHSASRSVSSLWLLRFMRTLPFLLWLKKLSQLVPCLFLTTTSLPLMIVILLINVLGLYYIQVIYFGINLNIDSRFIRVHVLLLALSVCAIG